jgi:hypothetical protein
LPPICRLANIPSPQGGRSVTAYYDPGEREAVRKLLLVALLSLVGALLIAPVALAQDSLCTTSVAAGGENVTKCVDAPVATPSATASPDVTVIGGGPLTPSPTAFAGGTTTSSLAAAVGGKLPGTGGEGFALVAAALLLGSGVMSYAILRRRG